MIPTNTSLEQQLFTWVDWDSLDTSSMQFEDCTLETQIGEYKKGDYIPIIVFSIEDSTLIFLTKEGQELNKYNLKISVAG